MKTNPFYFFIALIILTANSYSQLSKITLTSPTGGETLISGKSYVITWSSINVDSISIEYSVNNGKSWIYVEKSTFSMPRNLNWVVPQIESKNLLLKISDISNSDVFTISDPILIIPRTSSSTNAFKKDLEFNTTDLMSEMKIMPLGNSITRGVAGSSLNVGYRRSLFQRLDTSSYLINFVGTQRDGFITDFDLDHEGHGGWHAQHPTNINISIVDSVYSWLEKNSPNIILLHIGTNDIGEFQINGETTNDLIVEVEAILDSIEAYELLNEQNITVFLAKIINRTDDPATKTINESLATTQFNDKLDSMATARILIGANIVIVNMEEALIYPNDLYDGVHPNDNGYLKIADVWYTEIINYLNSLPVVLIEPSSKGVFEGGTTKFSVTASGKKPLSYQWQKDGEDILGASDSIYVTPSAFLNDDGTSYRCKISNSLGFVYSNNAKLYVTPADKRVLGGQLVNYEFNEGTGDTVRDNSEYELPLNLVIENTEATEWSENGLNINSPVNIRSVVNASKIVENCKISDEITIEAWIKPTDLNPSSPARIITNSLSDINKNFALDIYNEQFQVGFRTSITPDSGINIDSGDSTATKKLSQVVFSRSNKGVSKIYINSSEKVKDSLSLAGFLSNWNSNYNLMIANEFSDQRPFQGLFHLISIYDRELSESEILHNYQISRPNLENPSQLVISLDSTNSVYLIWQDNSTNEIGFIIERSVSDTVNFVVLDSLTDNSVDYSDSTLIDGTRYYYRIKSFNDLVESDNSNIVSIIKPLNGPSNLEVSLNSFDLPKLNWIDNSNGELGYIIEGRAAHQDSVFTVLDSLASNLEFYVDSIPKFYTPYIYRLFAFSQDTISVYSNEFEIDVILSNKNLSLEIPKQFNLYQNFPNPFNPETIIKFDLPQKSHVKMSIYNAIGELIKVIKDGSMLSGTHEISFNGSKYPSGIYFCAFNANSENTSSSYRNVIKLLLLK